MSSAKVDLYDRGWMAKARILCGMNNNQAAEACDISPGFYNRIENGVQLPNVKVGLKICRVLGVSPDNWLSEKKIS